MFCRKCGYNLEYIQSDNCPECGEPFDASNAVTYCSSPNSLKYRRWAKFAITLGVLTFTLLILAPLLLWNSEKLRFHYASLSLKDASIANLYGYADGPYDMVFNVVSIDLDVHGKGQMHFSCDRPDEFWSAKEVKLKGIGPYAVSDISDELLVNGMLSEYQKRVLAHSGPDAIGPLNIAAGAEASGLSSAPINSIQDAVNQYDDILNHIEEMIASNRDHKK